MTPIYVYIFVKMSWKILQKWLRRCVRFGKCLARQSNRSGRWAWRMNWGNEQWFQWQTLWLPQCHLHQSASTKKRIISTLFQFISYFISIKIGNCSAFINLYLRKLPTLSSFAMLGLTTRTYKKWTNKHEKNYLILSLFINLISFVLPFFLLFEQPFSFLAKIRC